MKEAPMARDVIVNMTTSSFSLPVTSKERPAPITRNPIERRKPNIVLLKLLGLSIPLYFSKL
jgi:hypothetical protein